MITCLKRHCGRRPRLSMAVAGCLLVVGCADEGPELADIRGTVTLDGNPLAGARVDFSPIIETEDAPARPVTAETDEDGQYVMHYSSSRSGALPGKYRVSISTFRPPDEDDDGNPVPGAPETVPEVYNMKTTLTADVSIGGPPSNFDLKSEAGPIVQPPADNDEMMEQEQDSGC